MESIGFTLREARERKGVSLADVARTTKVKYEILERIESDDTERLVSPTYTRGFIKLYADYLGLDGRALAEAYVNSQGGLRRRGLHVETVASTRRTRELRLPIKRAGILVAGLTVIVLLVNVISGLINGDEEQVAEEGLEMEVAEEVVTVDAPVVSVVINLPQADLDAFYQPRAARRPLLLDIPD